jgi:hypothetical protein
MKPYSVFVTKPSIVLCYAIETEVVTSSSPDDAIQKYKDGEAQEDMGWNQRSKYEADDKEIIEAKEG